MLESLELGKFERKNSVDFISRKIELSLILIIYSTLAKIYIYHDSSYRICNKICVFARNFLIHEYCCNHVLFRKSKISR